MHLADSHLKSAILSEERKCFLRFWTDSESKFPQYIKAQVKKFKKALKTEGAPFINSEKLYGQIYKGALTVPVKKRARLLFHRARQQASLDTGSICRGLASLAPTLEPELRRHMDNITSHIPCQQESLLQARDSWD